MKQVIGRAVAEYLNEQAAAELSFWDAAEREYNWVNFRPTEDELSWFCMRCDELVGAYLAGDSQAYDTFCELFEQWNGFRPTYSDDELKWMHAHHACFAEAWNDDQEYYEWD